MNFFKKNIDRESLRFDALSNKIIWTSKGNIKNHIPPALYKTDLFTGISTYLKLDNYFYNI